MITDNITYTLTLCAILFIACAVIVVTRKRSSPRVDNPIIFTSLDGYRCPQCNTGDKLNIEYRGPHAPYCRMCNASLPKECKQLIIELRAKWELNDKP